MNLNKPAVIKKLQERFRNVNAGRGLYTAFLVPTMLTMFSTRAFAADTIWTKASAIMQDVYTQILGISTIAAVVTAAIALLLMNFSRSGRTVDESRAWLKRIIITWAILNTYLRHKVMAEAEDEVTMEAPSTEYSENITEMAEFLLFLLDEREKLSAAIHQAKVSLPLGAGLDGEVSLNGKRQEIATLLRHMAGLRNGEVLISNGGVGYRFNNEGNQVSYRCDVKRVTTINFDRNKIRKMCANLSKKSDETSATLDAALVNTPVEYEAPFNVNETFAEAFEAHMSALS